MNADGLSYLDMASAAAVRGPGELVNGYWSPAYPALLSAALLLAEPRPEQEFPVVHAVNFLIFAAALGCFVFLLRSMRGAVVPVPFAFGLFLWFTTEFITLEVVTPDLLVAAVIFLASGLWWRGRLVAMAAVLGLGFWVKAAVLPLGAVLLVILAKRMGARVLLPAAVLVVVAAPFAVLVSRHVGHFSIGETGTLNYLWFVNGLPRYTGWTGQGPELHGKPLHPPRVLMAEPLVLEFGSPLPGTYPLWYEPSYWYAGARPRFDFALQAAAVGRNLWFLLWVGLVTSGLSIGLLVLRRGGRSEPQPDAWWMIAWPLAACCLYGLVHAEGRFLAPFLVLLWLALYGRFLARANSRIGGVVAALALCTLFAQSVKRLVPSDSPPDYLAAANQLQSAGIKPGDALAIVGRGFDAYYARATGSRIIVEIPDAARFARLSAADTDRVFQRLATVGVKAVVIRETPPRVVPVPLSRIR
jgi:hypothetical protein